MMMERLPSQELWVNLIINGPHRCISLLLHVYVF